MPSSEAIVAAPEPLHSFDELQTKWGIPYSRKQVRRLLQLGEVPEPIKDAMGRHLWRESAVVAYIESRGRVEGSIPAAQPSSRSSTSCARTGYAIRRRRRSLRAAGCVNSLGTHHPKAVQTGPFSISHAAISQRLNKRPHNKETAALSS